MSIGMKLAMVLGHGTGHRPGLRCFSGEDMAVQMVTAAATREELVAVHALRANSRMTIQRERAAARERADTIRAGFHKTKDERMAHHAAKLEAIRAGAPEDVVLRAEAEAAVHMEQAAELQTLENARDAALAANEEALEAYSAEQRALLEQDVAPLQAKADAAAAEALKHLRRFGSGDTFVAVYWPPSFGEFPSAQQIAAWEKEYDTQEALRQIEAEAGMDRQARLAAIRELPPGAEKRQRAERAEAAIAALGIRKGE